MEWLFSLLRFRNKYLYCLGIRRSIRKAFWILFFITIAMTAGILVVCFTLTRRIHPCHFGLKRVIKSSIVSSSRPRSVAVGDFNNDHKMDIIVANSGTNAIGVFLSQGDGVFDEQETYLTDSDSHPCSVAVSHLNDDDYLDIAVASYATNNISIFLGNGDGTFISHRQFSTGSSHPLLVTTGDLNNDNVTDLIVVNYGTSSVGVHLGYGDGSFQQQTKYSTDYDSDPRSLGLGDFNNDTHLDIAVANYGTSNIGILLGYGDGTFASQKTYTTQANSHPSSIALGDFNHDHHLDIVVSNNGSRNVGIFLGHGDGTFQAQRIYPLDYYSHPAYIAMGKLNEDNEIDVVIVDSINDRVHILLGDGSGTFVTTTTYDTVLKSNPISVAVADFNNNNQSDIVVVNYGTNNVLVLMDYWSQPSTRQKTYKTETYGNPALAVGDFNNDHIPDIISTTAGLILVLNGLADGTFDERSVSTITMSANAMTGICLGDVNNDNWMDIVSANSYDDSIGVLLGGGNGTFGSVTTYSTGQDSYPVWVTVGDMNADGRLDIVCANKHSGNIGVMLGNGDGTFATMITCSTGIGSSPVSVALGDINNDHRLDIVIGDAYGFVLISFGDNTGACDLSVGFHAGERIVSIVVADFNNDNNLDIAVADIHRNRVGVFLGYWDIASTVEAIYPIGNGAQPSDMIVNDFNNDNISDLVVAVRNNDEVVIFYGNGTGSFTLAKRYSTEPGSKPTGIAVAHFDHSNKLEIVVTLWGSGKIAVLTEYTAAEFVNQVAYSTGATAQPFSVAAGDFTHDNRSDVVVANSGIDSLGISVGLGNGTFGTEMTYPLGPNSQPQYVITYDINQDQQLDIVSVNWKLNSITVMMGQSDGTFSNERMYSTGNDSRPYAVASGDLNNDGRLDLVIANQGTDSIGVLVAFDYTTFQSRMIYSSNESLQLTGIVASDFNNDGLQDLATIFYMTGQICIFLGCGNDTFILLVSYSIGNTTKPIAIAASDLNNDGEADIVVCDSRNDDICILLGYGNGSFATARRYSSGGSLPISIAVGDMDNDGRLDLVVVNHNAGNVGLLRGYGDGTFDTMQLLFTREHFRPFSIVLADLDNDGRLDAVVSNVPSDYEEIVLISGAYVFQDRVIQLPIASCQPRRATVGDFNNDSLLDIVTADYGHGDVLICLGDGSGTCPKWVRYFTGPGFIPTSLDVGDFNNDTILDIVAVSIVGNNVVILFGVGDGTFLLGRAHSTGSGSAPWALATGDFNNDAQLDIAVVNFYTNNILVFLGRNNELFADAQVYATGYGSQPHSVALGDLNNDHQMDIVVANYGTDSVGVFLGRNGTTFTSMDVYPTETGSRPYCVATGDLNNDTYLDIVVTASETENIFVLFGFGNGTFVINARYSTGRLSRPYALVISDFNNDNICDIAIANSGTSNIFLFYGYANGTFKNEASYSLGYGYHPYSIAVTDLNADGWMDIVVACYDTDRVETFIQMC